MEVAIVAITASWGASAETARAGRTAMRRRSTKRIPCRADRSVTTTSSDRRRISRPRFPGRGERGGVQYAEVEPPSGHGQFAQFREEVGRLPLPAGGEPVPRGVFPRGGHGGGRGVDRKDAPRPSPATIKPEAPGAAEPHA